MTYKICQCGSGWDTHGIYSTCPICARGTPAQRDATEQESAIIAQAYAAHDYSSTNRAFKP